MAEQENILVISTALNGYAIGLSIGEQFYTSSDYHERGQAERLVPAIERLFSDAGVGFDALDAVVIVNGPGSFTGLRIGIATAEGYAAALDIPLYACTSFEVLNNQYRLSSDIKGVYACVLETKRDDFYVQAFDENGKALSEAMALLEQEMLTLFEEKKVMQLFGNKLSFTTVERFLTTKVDAIDPHYFVSYAKSMVSLKLLNRYVEPLYLRGADVSLSQKTQRKLV